MRKQCLLAARFLWRELRELYGHVSCRLPDGSGFLLAMVRVPPAPLDPDEVLRFDLEVALLEVLGERAAMAIENARLVAELQERTEQLRQRTEELEMERERRERFMSMVVHDLRGPVTALRGYAQLLQRYDQLPPEKVKQALQTIEAETRRLERLLADLSDASAIASGRFTISREPMDLAELVQQVVHAQQLTTSKHRIIYEGPEHLRGWWDSTRLAQAVNNLVGNAIKFSPRGGDIRVRLRLVDTEAELCVTDQGIGLTQEEMAEIFQPFARAGRARGLPGAGLGLYITKGIVEAHGGRIWVESSGPDKGSTFCFTLPLTTEQQKKAKEHTDP